MKREYQSAVHFKKESKTDLCLGTAVFVFILGILSVTFELQYQSAGGSLNWFGHCISASAIILGCLVVFGLIHSYKNYGQVAFAIDSNDQGLWINSGRKLQMIYIPFSMVEITCNQGILTIKYQNAFCYTSKGKLRMLSSGKERFRIKTVDKNEFQEFVTRLNQLARKSNEIKLSEQDLQVSSFKWESLLGGILLFCGLACTLGFNPGIDAFVSQFIGQKTNSTTSSDNFNAEPDNSQYFKWKDLKYNQAYVAKKINLTVNKAYRGQTKSGKNVVIFNVTLLSKSSDSEVGNFYMTTDKNILSDGGEYAQSPLNTTILSVGGKNSPVVNQLDDEDDYCNPMTEGTGKKLTFNVVFSLSNEKKTGYLIYTDFDLQGKPDEFNNQPAYILKFDPQKLEVLQ